MGTENVQKIRIYLLFAISLACLTCISFISSYKVPDLSESSWDTVLFLTPVGIAKNFSSKNPVMKSFYSDYGKGQVLLPKMLFMSIFILFLVGIFFKLIKVFSVKD
jgi:uncharacterized membrane protein SirB2